MVRSRERLAPKEHPDAVIDRLASVQHGVITRGQLGEAGLRPGAIDRRVASRRLHRLFRGVYRVGPIQAPRAREMAALLACGPGAVLSHRSAGAFWECVAATDAVEVTVAPATRVRLPGIVAHRSRFLPDTQVVNRDGLRITSALRTIVDLAAVLPAGELEQAIARMERHGHTKSAALLDWAAANPRSRAARAIRLQFADGFAPAFTRSEAEKRLLALIRRARLAAPQVNQRLHGYEVDFLWSHQKLVAEVDGFAYHASARAFASDRRRDAALTANGYRVIRLTWNDIVRQPEATVVILAQALARG